MSQKTALILASILFSVLSCNIKQDKVLSVDKIYTFDSTFTNSSSLIIREDTIMFLDNKTRGTVTYNLVDVKNNIVIDSSLYKEAYSLGYATFDSITNEYVFPIQNAQLGFQNTNGNSRVLEINSNMKFNPIIFSGLVFFQGKDMVGVVDMSTFKTIWTYPDIDGFSISQPILINNNVIFLLSNETLVSCDFLTGAVNWTYKSNTKLQISNLYNYSDGRAYVLYTDLQNQIQIETIDIENGTLIEQKNINDSIDVWATSSIIIDDNIYCKGYDKVFVYNLNSFSKINEFSFPSLIGTKLVRYFDKVLCSTYEGRTLFVISEKGLELMNIDLDYFDIKSYMGNVYLYSYPNLYKLNNELLNDLTKHN